jgi:hypothetical protein
MPNDTTILNQESGTQYQGVVDSSGRTGRFPVVGLMIGKFKRGRLDKPMTITKANIRSMLGYDPKNPDYVAVQDLLDTNVQSIQVIRVYKPIIPRGWGCSFGLDYGAASK